MATHILVIEDNSANSELIVYLLNVFGYSTMVAGDGESGFELAQRERPDLIICDLQIPKINGYEVARRLKRDPVLQNTPLVAVTAYAMVDDRDKALAAGFDGYIAKPINPETFVQQVEGFLTPPASRLPLPVPPSASPARSAASLGATILVVDNSGDNIQLVRSIFEPFGYTVISTERVQQALEWLQESRPILIISDVHMHEESGFDLLEAVKADPQLRNICFVFLTSTVVGSLDERRAMDMGADRFLVRPIEAEILLAELEACLGEGRK